MVAVDAQLAAMLSTEPRIRSKAEVVDAARAAAGLPRRYDYSEPGPAEPDVESPAVASTSSADAAEFLQNVAAHATLHCEVSARTVAAADADRQPVHVTSSARVICDERDFGSMEDPNHTPEADPNDPHRLAM